MEKIRASESEKTRFKSPPTNLQAGWPWAGHQRSHVQFAHLEGNNNTYSV